MKISRVTGYFDLKKPSEFKNFLISKEILNIVQSYLNTRLVSINASFFISNPVEISDDIKYQNAQFFHWDNDFRKFVKLYIYLNDVDEHSGPHVFVEQTHKTKDKKITNFVDYILIFQFMKNILNQILLNLQGVQALLFLLTLMVFIKVRFLQKNQGYF